MGWRWGDLRLENPGGSCGVGELHRSGSAVQLDRHSWTKAEMRLPGEAAETMPRRVKGSADKMSPKEV